MARRKREAKRVPKESRKNLKMWAEGARETILAPYMDDYSKALDEGWRTERKCLKRICNEFHARVDWRLQDHEEPVLADYDPKKMIVPEDPYAVLVSKLAGIKPATKARQAYQQFMHESYDDKIAGEVAAEWEKEGKAGNLARPKQPKAGFRAKVARDVFAKLPAEEQTCIDRVSDFLGPILRGVQEYTGPTLCGLMGGPIPKLVGSFGHSSIVSYVATEPPPANTSHNGIRSVSNTDVLDFMKEYLAASFTPQECAEAALPGSDDLANAKYTIGDRDNDASSKVAGKAKAKETNDSDSESESDSDSDPTRSQVKIRQRSSTLARRASSTANPLGLVQRVGAARAVAVPPHGWYHHYNTLARAVPGLIIAGPRPWGFPFWAGFFGTAVSTPNGAGLFWPFARIRIRMLLFAVPTPGHARLYSLTMVLFVPAAVRTRPRAPPPLRAPRPPFRPPCGLPSPLQLIYTHPSLLLIFRLRTARPRSRLARPRPSAPSPTLPSRSVHLDVALLSLAVAPPPFSPGPPPAAPPPPPPATSNNGQHHRSLHRFHSPVL
ncbi:hypothetical protein B0H11DRAFT_2255531 [Mycena galericulata]|nr:hypothetical protein B0H11DRAFT_2255531 [Mycena galericulata]